jgi:hypothetical protein
MTDHDPRLPIVRARIAHETEWPTLNLADRYCLPQTGSDESALLT